MAQGGRGGEESGLKGIYNIMESQNTFYPLEKRENTGFLAILALDIPHEGTLFFHYVTVNCNY